MASMVFATSQDMSSALLSLFSRGYRFATGKPKIHCVTSNLVATLVVPIRIQLLDLREHSHVFNWKTRDVSPRNGPWLNVICTRTQNFGAGASSVHFIPRRTKLLFVAPVGFQHRMVRPIFPSSCSRVLQDAYDRICGTNSRPTSTW